jgi:hypothetical protein
LDFTSQRSPSYSRHVRAQRERTRAMASGDPQVFWLLFLNELQGRDEYPKFNRWINEF